MDFNIFMIEKANKLIVIICLIQLTMVVMGLALRIDPLDSY